MSQPKDHAGQTVAVMRPVDSGTYVVTDVAPSPVMTEGTVIRTITQDISVRMNISPNGVATALDMQLVADYPEYFYARPGDIISVDSGAVEVQRMI